jgi:hypothetical protein
MLHYNTKIVLSDFFRRLNYQIVNLQRFGSWIRREGKVYKAYLLARLVELASEHV